MITKDREEKYQKFGDLSAFILRDKRRLQRPSQESLYLQGPECWAVGSK